MARISFSQKEISGNPVSGVELDRYLIQGDNTLLNAESLLKIDAAGDAVEVPAGTGNQVLKMLAGSPVFQNFSQDESLTQAGHLTLDNGLILNWQTVTSLAALSSVTIAHDKPFSSLILGNSASVVDANAVRVQVTAETLAGVTLKNFDAVNPASIIKVFSFGI